MNINKQKIEGEIVSNTLQIAPFKILSVDHAVESSSKYMTTIYHYFCIKNDRFFLSKKIMKICSKMHQIARFKKILEEACPRTPLANAWLCHAP